VELLVLSCAVKAPGCSYAIQCVLPELQVAGESVACFAYWLMLAAVLLQAHPATACTARSAAILADSTWPNGVI